MHSVTITIVGCRTAATSKMERFVIIVNGFQPSTIITKRSILYVAAVLDPLLINDTLKGIDYTKDSRYFDVTYEKLSGRYRHEERVNSF